MGALSTLSKKRYAALQAELELRRGEWGISSAHMDEVLRTLREVMRFDPEEKQYTQEKGRRKMELEKARAAERGVSVYALRKMGTERGGGIKAPN